MTPREGGALPRPNSLDWRRCPARHATLFCIFMQFMHMPLGAPLVLAPGRSGRCSARLWADGPECEHLAIAKCSHVRGDEAADSRINPASAPLSKSVCERVSDVSVVTPLLFESATTKSVSASLDLPPVHLLTTADAVQQALPALGAAPVLGVDVETTGDCEPRHTRRWQRSAGRCSPGWRAGSCGCADCATRSEGRLVPTRSRWPVPAEPDASTPAPR